jgi:hypothetical protein
LTGEINSSRLRENLARTVGPAPWYWKTFPVIDSPDRRFGWSHHGEEGALAHLVTLNVDGESEKPLLALNTYCRPFVISSSRLGVWCPEGRHIRLVCFDSALLKPFDLAEIAGWFKQSSDRIYATTAPIAEFEIPLAMPVGMHNVEVPAEFRSVDELIVPTSYPAKSNDDPAFALYIFYLQAGLLEVLPQKWFTKSQYDVGYQWITRAARDPESQRIFGDGFKLGTFLLEEDGCRFDRWIDRVP